MTDNEPRMRTVDYSTAPRMQDEDRARRAQRIAAEAEMIADADAAAWTDEELMTLTEDEIEEMSVAMWGRLCGRLVKLRLAKMMKENNK